MACQAVGVSHESHGAIGRLGQVPIREVLRIRSRIASTISGALSLSPQMALNVRSVVSDQAWSLQPNHRTFGRESIPVRAIFPPAPPASDAAPLPDTDAEIARIADALRRAIRLAGLAYATEETYVQWNIRFTRFCLTD